MCSVSIGVLFFYGKFAEIEEWKNIKLNLDQAEAVYHVDFVCLAECFVDERFRKFNHSFNI